MTPLEIAMAIAAGIEPLSTDLVRLERKVEARPLPERGTPGAPGVGLDSPAWKPGVYREGALVGHFLGQLFRATRDTAAEPGSGDDWQRLGNAGLRFRGALEEGAATAPGDLYTRDTSLFLVDWDGQAHLINYRGKKGLRGDPGPKGKDGAGLVSVRQDNTCVVFDWGETGERALDLGPLLERFTTELIARELAPLLEQIGQRLVNLERGL